MLRYCVLLFACAFSSHAAPHDFGAGRDYWQHDPHVYPSGYGPPFSYQDRSPERLMQHLQDTYARNTYARLARQGSCTPQNIAVRKEWSNLSDEERDDYISAVKCLATKPSKSDPAIIPGAKSAYDDLTAAHINQTYNIHWTGKFFPWHRQFVYMIETMLREECGYQGYQPYWDWSKYAYAPTPEDNPLYSGSSTSLSGDGKAIPHNDTVVTVPSLAALPTGLGGGCLYDGPFVDWVVNLGPVEVTDGNAGPPNPQKNGLGYNPRCLQRDFYPLYLQQRASYQNVTDLILNYTSIHTFHPWMENQQYGAHASGHLFIGGLNNDLFSSPGDPLFFFHHAQVDRVWSIWQSLDFASRTDALDGTLTLLNNPPSRNVTLDDYLEFSDAFGDVKISTTMSPTQYNYCYLYE